jgi:hypothetical protein
MSELQRRQVQISLDLFEPFHTVARRRLPAQRLDPAFGLIAFKSLRHVRVGIRILGPRNRVVKGQPRPRPDSEIPRRRRIPNQHNVFMLPCCVDHPRELHIPRRAAQMRRIRYKIMPPRWWVPNARQASTASSLDSASNPSMPQVSGRVSTMKVAVLLNW